MRKPRHDIMKEVVNTKPLSTDRDATRTPCHCPFPDASILFCPCPNAYRSNASKLKKKREKKSHVMEKWLLTPAAVEDSTLCASKKPNVGDFSVSAGLSAQT